MRIHTTLALAAALAALLSSPLAYSDPRDGGPDRTRPGRGGGDGGNGGTPPGQDPDRTPPGQNPDRTPPGHGGPNPGRGHGRVERGATRVCGADGADVVGPLGQAGASHVAHVAFAPAEDSDGASWARMMYFWIGTTFDFNVNAHALEPGSEWTLLATAADGSAICLGDGSANPGGELHLRDSIELDSHLPDGLDPFAETPEGEDPEGATLQLVPSDGVDCDAGTVTASDDALTSEEAIRFVDVDEVTCPG